MCNNNGHCRKFDAGTMCPSYRVTRDEQHLTRGRANTLRLALSGQLGPDAFTGEAVREAHGPVRRLQGLQARLPDRRRHGEDEDRVPRRTTRRSTATRSKDRLVARLPDYAARRQPHALAAATCATACPAPRWLGEQLLGLVGQALAAALAQRHLLARPRPVARSPAASRRSPRLAAAARRRCCSSTPSTAASRARTRWPPRACCKAAGYTAAHASRRSAATIAAAAPTWPTAWSTRPRPRRRRADRRAAAARRSGHRDRRAGAFVPADPARRDAGRWAWAPRRRPSRPRRCCSRSSSRARAQAGRFELALKPADKPILLHGHCHQKAFGAVSPILEVLQADPRREARADRELLLRHGRQLRLRGRALRGLDADGRGRACCPRCAASPTPSSWPTAPAAATRSPTARSARRCTWRGCSMR